MSRHRSPGNCVAMLWVLLATLTSWGLSWQLLALFAPDMGPDGNLAAGRLALVVGLLSGCANLIAWPLLAGLLQVSVFLFTGQEIATEEARRVAGWTYFPFFIAGSLAMLITGITPPRGPEDLDFLNALRVGALVASGGLVVNECRKSWKLQWWQCLAVLGAPTALYMLVRWFIHPL
ncbi:MAG: hypothetical protein Kow00109_15590 [Acidobacteriota bacterium]